MYKQDSVLSNLQYAIKPNQANVLIQVQDSKIASPSYTQRK